MSALFAQNPIDNPQVWDQIVLSGVPSPGVLKDGSLEDAKRVHTFDIKRGKGTVGATVTFTEKPPAEIKFTLYVWTQDHFDQLDSWLTLLKYDPTKKGVSAVDIYHPALDAIDISSAVCTNIGGIKHEGKQLYSISIEMLEYFPTPNQSATSTPTGAAGTPPPPNNPGNPPPTAATAEEKEIAALIPQAFP